jgi:hypothetical protein
MQHTLGIDISKDRLDAHALATGEARSFANDRAGPGRGCSAGPAASARRWWSTRRPAPITACSSARWPGPGSAFAR